MTNVVSRAISDLQNQINELKARLDLIQREYALPNIGTPEIQFTYTPPDERAEQELMQAFNGG